MEIPPFISRRIEIRKTTTMKTLMSLLLLVSSFVVYAQDTEKSIDFEEIYKAWDVYVESVKKDGFSKYRNPDCDAMVNIGPIILPKLIQKFKSGKARAGFIIGLITKAKIKSYSEPSSNIFVFPDYPDFTYNPKYLQKPNENAKSIWIFWWEDGRKRTPELFSKKYGEWKAALIEGKKEDETRAKYKAIQDLGIVALPQILEKIKGGDKELIPMFSELVDGKVAKTTSARACQDWWEKNKSFYDTVLNY